MALRPFLRQGVAHGALGTELEGLGRIVEYDRRLKLVRPEPGIPRGRRGPEPQVYPKKGDLEFVPRLLLTCLGTTEQV